MKNKAAHFTAPLFLAGALYFTYYMALGSLMPFINLHYERLGLSGLRIGALTALPVLVSSATVMVWGSIADALHLHNRILRIALLGGAGAILLLSTARSFPILVLFVVAYAFFTSPVVPLLDSSALEVAKKRERSYGQLRVWGAVGWSVATLAVGALIERFATGFLFYGYVLFVLLTLGIALFQREREEELRSPLRQGLTTLLLDRALLLFLVSVFLVSLTISGVSAFFSIYLDAIGAGEGSIGLAWAIASISEIPIMLYSGRIIRRTGAGGLLKIAFLTFALRWLLLSFIETPAFAIALQALHGISFGAYLVGGVTYMSERAPAGLGTTAQSLFNLVAFGAGSIGGSLLGGYLYDRTGMFFLFRVLSVVAALGLVVLLASRRLEGEAVAR